MAKKTRKVLKQESQQRAMQQAVANVNAAEAATAASAAAEPAAAPTRVVKAEASDEQDFTFVRSDVRRSLTLAGIFAVAMIALSFVLR